MCIVFSKSQEIKDTRFVQPGALRHDSVKSCDILPPVPFVIDVAPREAKRRKTREKKTPLASLRVSAATFFMYHREFVNAYGTVAIYG